ncbi:MAG: amidase family protein [Firmicutes bacterium]|nr:amidase family protein [Bacillota bacterium]
MELQGFAESASVVELQRAMQEGKCTALELTVYFLQRIARYNHEGPGLNAVLEVNPDALQIAEALDAQRQTRGTCGPLHGIPVLIKDNISTGDKMHTSAGSLALAQAHARQDAFVVRQLRKAGCVILGKTNLTEWANFMANDMPNGYSSRGGQVRSAYHPGVLDVGGSSSGSGVAVSASLAPLAVGTETSGSILSPASSNSVVGLKPTVGLISRTGIIPISHSQDTAGPMAKSVADVAALLGAMAGVDADDAITQTAVGRALPDYVACLDASGLRGARIGIVRKPYYEGLPDAAGAVMNQAMADLQAAGAELIDDLTFSFTEDIRDYAVLLYEFKPDLNDYLRSLEGGPVHSLADVIAFNEEHHEQALRFGQAILIAAEEKSGTLTEVDYLDARARDLACSRQNGIDQLLREHRLDALLFPANYGAAIAAKAGYPSICVPGGYLEDGSPFGVTFTGTAFSEPTLLRLAYAYEQTSLRRVAPDLVVK